MNNTGELVLQNQGRRFYASAHDREFCKVCGATVFEQKTFGNLVEGEFKVLYFIYACVECKTETEPRYPAPVTEKVEKKK